MIKTYTAYTYESEDIELAVSEIKAQLDTDKNILINTVGVISCHYEFVVSGVLKAVCNALPFDTIGSVSTVQSIGEHTANKLFTIMVITSDTVDFENVLTPSLEKNANRFITEYYKEAAIGKYGRPSLILTYAPFMLKSSADEYIDALSKASYGAPCFGTFAIDDSNGFTSGNVIFNGEHYSDRMVMSLFFGSVKPKFYIANISPDRLMGEGAIVTKSLGHTVMEVNNLPVYEFLKELNLIKTNDGTSAIDPFPFFLDYHDNTPLVAKIFLELTPEHHAVCAGTVPEKCTIYAAINEREDIMKTTGEVLDKMVKDAENARGLLIYTCGTRFMAMSNDFFGEVRLVYSKLGGNLPLLISSAGGEFCPTTMLNEKSINRFHNNSFVACMF